MQTYDNSYIGRPCVLYTLDGEKPARVTGVVPGRLAYIITAADGSLSMAVLLSVVLGKYQDDTCPTFYAC